MAIYLDNNATTALAENVRNAMFEIMGRPLNASSIHADGRYARSIVENARKKIAAFINAKDCRVIFTASGTEGNNLAVNGLDDYKILFSAIEHPSMLKSANAKNGEAIAVDEDGVIDLNDLEAKLKQHEGNKILVSVMLANNETGVIQPLKKIAEIAHKYGAIMHSDAVQCLGKMKIDMENLGVDMLTISAHKAGGPQGAAALVIKKKVPLTAQIKGGGQESTLRAGTENVAAIHGFAASLENEYPAEKIQQMRNRLEKEIKNFAPETVIFGENAERLVNTSYLTMNKATSDTQAIFFDLNGICVSSGSACSSGRIESSHVLKAMGVEENIAKTVIRVSLGKENTQQDVEEFIKAWKELYKKVSA